MSERAVVGKAREFDVAHALAKGGTAWIDRHGLVVAKGGVQIEEALKAHPETAAVLKAFSQAQERWKARYAESYQADLADHLSKGEAREAFFFGSESFEIQHPRPQLEKYLARNGWIEVNICRYRNDMALCTHKRDDVDAYRTALTTLADSMNCRLLQDSSKFMPDVLYDPLDRNAPTRFSPKTPDAEVTVDHGGPVPLR